jgi:hypothetical protein
VPVRATLATVGVLSLPSTSTAARSALELTLVERGSEEPLLGFYSPTPLTPGAWSERLDLHALPQALRRLEGELVLAGRRRQVELRCLAMLPALAYLLGEERGPASASVRAWRLAARVVEQMLLAGGDLPDLTRFAAAFPPAAHAALDRPPVRIGEEPEPGLPLSAHEAVAEFAAATTRAVSAAVSDPRLLAAPKAHADVIDLQPLQPLLRAVAPGIGAPPPVVRLRESLAPLRVELLLPEAGEDGWPLRVEPSDGGPALARRAAHMFPPLAAAGPGLRLTAEQAQELRLAAPALEFAGAQVVLPDELRETAELGLEGASLHFAGGPGLGNVVQYDLTAALGGRRVSQEEFAALARATQPLVRLGGQWRVLDQAALARARQIAALALHGASMPALTALGAALAGSTELRGMDVAVELDGDEGGIAELVRRLGDSALRERVTAPDGFHGVLRPYQEAGLGWLLRMRGLGLGACLADDMGLGKTVQLIAYLLDRSDEPQAPTLIICPTSVLGNWQRELERFAPELRVLVHHGPDRTLRASRLEPFDVVVSAYALLARDRRILTAFEWRALVLDEAQQVKNPLTRQAQAARAVGAGHRVALTGTPIENRLDELWSIMQVLNPGLLDTRAAFRRRYAAPIERRRDDEAAERLGRVIDPFILRRRKSDPRILPDLPARLEFSERCTLTLEQAALYQATLDTLLGRVRGTAGIERRAQVLTLLTRLKQVCNHPAHALGDRGGRGSLANRSGKLDRLTEMLSEAVAEGDSALVFTQYAVMGNMLADHVSRELELERLYLDGSTPRAARERVVDRFQEPETPPSVLVMSLRAGGLGLNLTRASHVFHFDRWWNPAVEDQASDRAHRIGQTQVVQIHRLICAGTIEERIDEMIEGKRELARRIVDRGAETAISELSDDQLEELVALRT